MQEVEIGIPIRVPGYPVLIPVPGAYRIPARGTRVPRYFDDHGAGFQNSRTCSFVLPSSFLQVQPQQAQVQQPNLMGASPTHFQK
eukprot:3247026-Rhodomonas_salina.2